MRVRRWRSPLEVHDNLRDLAQRRLRLVQVSPYPPDRGTLVLRRLLHAVQADEQQRVLERHTWQFAGHSLGDPDVAVLQRPLEFGVAMNRPTSRTHVRTKDPTHKRSTPLFKPKVALRSGMEPFGSEWLSRPLRLTHWDSKRADGVAN